MYTLELECTYNGVDYRVIENLKSGLLLVVPKDKYDNNEYPMAPVIIPEKGLEFHNPR